VLISPSTVHCKNQTYIQRWQCKNPDLWVVSFFPVGLLEGIWHLSLRLVVVLERAALERSRWALSGWQHLDKLSHLNKFESILYIFV
jgi:hypothetical protein